MGLNSREYRHHMKISYTQIIPWALVFKNINQTFSFLIIFSLNAASFCLTPFSLQQSLALIIPQERTIYGGTI